MLESYANDFQSKHIPTLPKHHYHYKNLTERQRLELYELRAAALREIEEAEAKVGRGNADPYLRRYLQSIDDLLIRDGQAIETSHESANTMSTI